MRLARPEQKRAARRSEAVILFSVGGFSFAIAASAVEEIRSASGLRPLETAGKQASPVAKVRHWLERGGKVYTVVDAALYFRCTAAPLMRILVLRRRAVALLVEQIGLMAEISALYALPHACNGDERQWYRGLALLPGARGEVEVVPVVNPDAFLSQTEAQSLIPLCGMLRGRGVAL